MSADKSGEHNGIECGEQQHKRHEARHVSLLAAIFLSSCWRSAEAPDINRAIDQAERVYKTTKQREGL